MNNFPFLWLSVRVKRGEREAAIGLERAQTTMNPPPENSRRGLLATPWLRFPLYILLGYVGLVSMLLFFEKWLVFPATTAAQHWQPPSNAR